MESIQITNMSVTDLQRMLKSMLEEAKELGRNEQKPPSDWEELTLEEAAAELHCCPATIRRKMIALNITGLRVGKRILLKRKDLKKIKSGS